MVVRPLDLQTIFVNYFAGSMVVFVFITFVLMLYLSARYRMPNSALLVMVVFYSMILIGIQAPASVAYLIIICAFIGLGWIGAKLWKY